MKQYKGLRPLEDIYALMKDKKMTIDSKDFEKGGDYVNFKGGWDNKPLTIAVNTFNGGFFVSNGFTGEIIGTHLTTDKDGEQWYDNILETLYLPLT